MKKLFALVAAVSVSAAAHAATFQFSWTGDSGYNAGNNVVTGTFDGTANGNVISNLSNISVFINGVGFNGNGNLFGSSYANNWGWVSGGAQASFDGTQNNFLFINSDYPNDYSYSNYFYSVFNGSESFAYNWSNGYDNYQYVSGAANAGNWSVTQSDVPEPAGVALFGLGLLALAYMRGKKGA